MARSRQPVIYLDTHIVVWLYAGLIEKFTNPAKAAINTGDVVISQIIRLELQYLFEIKRIKVKPPTIIKGLTRSIDLKVSSCSLAPIIEEALKINWTRDVFDRLLVAEAIAMEGRFITADENIRSNFSRSVW